MLLDKFTVTKPDVSDAVTVRAAAPEHPQGGAIVFNVQVDHHGTIALNGTQVVLSLPRGFAPESRAAGTTVHARDVIVTLGRLAAGDSRTLAITANVSQGDREGLGDARVLLRSGTAQPVIGQFRGSDDHKRD